jgi:hypothetical protein
LSLRLITFTALWVLLSAHLVGASPGETSKAIVHGNVTDPSSATIPGAKVYFTHGKKTIRIRTSPTGTYSAKLAPGIYSLRITLPGFCDGIRGEFLARADSHINFDFRLTMAAAPVVATVVIGPYGYVTPPSRSIGGCYKSEELAAPVSNGPKPLVLYEKREVSGDVVRYSGLRYNSAIYMYDQMTIRATTLEYSAKDNSIEGSGGVMLQDGQTTTNAYQLRVSFHDGKPQIDSTD